MLGEAAAEGEGELRSAAPARPSDEEMFVRLMAEFDAEEIHADPQPDPDSMKGET